MLIAVNKAPIATLNAIVIKILLTKEYAAFSNVSIFGVHTENGSFSKRTVFKFMRFHIAVMVLIAVHSGVSCRLGAAGAGAAGSASVSDSGFVFVLLSFISFLVCM